MREMDVETMFKEKLELLESEQRRITKNYTKYYCRYLKRQELLEDRRLKLLDSISSEEFRTFMTNINSGINGRDE